jgi:hypothetical protein
MLKLSELHVLTFNIECFGRQPVASNGGVEATGPMPEWPSGHPRVELFLPQSGTHPHPSFCLLRAVKKFHVVVNNRLSHVS